MKDIIEFSEYVRKARPNTKDSSIKVYYGIYKQLNDGILEDGVKGHQYKIIEKYLNEKIKNSATRRNYYVVIMILTEAENGGKYTDKWATLPEWIFYKCEIDKLNNKIKATQKANGGLTDNQKENMATQGEVDLLMDKLGNVYVKNMVRQWRKEKKDDVKHYDWPAKLREYHVAYVLFSMYLELPVRNELASLQYRWGKKYLKNKKEELHNVCIWVPSEKRFYLVRNEYKTSDKYGRIETPLSSGLSKILYDYWEIYNNQPLHLEFFPSLMTTKDPQLNLTKLLNRVSEDIIGKKISSRMMTKISISTPELASAVETLQQVADTRGTSVGVVANNYVVGGGGGGGD
jgi:hypothetical protein